MEKRAFYYIASSNANEHRHDRMQFTETPSSRKHRTIVWPSYFIPGYISGSGVTIQMRHVWPCVYCGTIHNSHDVELQ